MKSSNLFVGTVLAVLLGVAGTPRHAAAACTWSFDCTSGSCRQVPVCTNSFDIVPPRPPAVAPIPTPSIRPIPQPMIPPIGTTICSPRQVCGMGGCRWQTLCR
jgi:hypothetical protein